MSLGRSAPLIGFRLWRIADDEFHLYSLTEDEPWPVGQPHESHLMPNNDAVSTPGLHGYYRFFHEQEYRLTDSFALWYQIEKYGKRLWGRSGQHWVAGAFIGWGRNTVLHEHGFRCQYGAPVALHYQPGEKDLNRARSKGLDWRHPPKHLCEIAAEYGLPLCANPNQLIGYAQEWGQLYTEALA
jgi:hypothetical protein